MSVERMRDEKTPVPQLLSDTANDWNQKAPSDGASKARWKRHAGFGPRQTPATHVTGTSVQTFGLLDPARFRLSAEHVCRLLRDRGYVPTQHAAPHDGKTHLQPTPAGMIQWLHVHGRCPRGVYEPIYAMFVSRLGIKLADVPAPSRHILLIMDKPSKRSAPKTSFRTTPGYLVPTPKIRDADEKDMKMLVSNVRADGKCDNDREDGDGDGDDADDGDDKDKDCDGEAERFPRKGLSLGSPGVKIECLEAMQLELWANDAFLGWRLETTNDVARVRTEFSLPELGNAIRRFGSDALYRHFGIEAGTLVLLRRPMPSVGYSTDVVLVVASDGPRAVADAVRGLAVPKREFVAERPVHFAGKHLL
jgi:hypothetical protein